MINRGNYRRDVFQDEGAAEAFERTLGEAATRFGWRVAAYVVMRNHFHLAVETPEPNLSLGMKWLQGTWARRFNRFRNEVGRPFQGRFKSLVIEDGDGFRRVCDYIHLNPVRARVVPADEVGTYRRSSLWCYLNGKGADWMDGIWILNAVGGLKNSPAGWRHYCDRLAVMMEDKEARESLSAKHLSRGWCVGNDEFKRLMREGMSEQLAQWRERRFAGLEPEAVKDERQRSWEEALVTCARAANIDLAKLTAKKSDEGKVLLAMVMKSSTSVSNGWLALRLGMGKPASVSQFVRRGMADFRQRRRFDNILLKVRI